MWHSNVVALNYFCGPSLFAYRHASGRLKAGRSDHVAAVSDSWAARTVAVLYHPSTLRKYSSANCFLHCKGIRHMAHQKPISWGTLRDHLGSTVFFWWSPHFQQCVCAHAACLGNWIAEVQDGWKPHACYCFWKGWASWFPSTSPDYTEPGNAKHQEERLVWVHAAFFKCMCTSVQGKILSQR